MGGPGTQNGPSRQNQYGAGGQNPNPNQGSKTTGSPLEDLARSALGAASSAAETLQHAKFPESPQKAIAVARLVIDLNGSVMKLDKAMQDLEKAAPGTSGTVKETAKVFAEAAKIVPTKDIPADFKPLASAVQKSSGSFEKFAADYDAYTKAPAYSLFSPSTWGVKTAAATKALASWNAFKMDYQKLDAEVSKIPGFGDPDLRKAAQGAAGAALDTLERLLKP